MTFFRFSEPVKIPRTLKVNGQGQHPRVGHPLVGLSEPMRLDCGDGRLVRVGQGPKI